MEEVKATSIAVTKDGNLVIVDTEGRVWLKHLTGDRWSEVKLPTIKPEAVTIDGINLS